MTGSVHATILAALAMLAASLAIGGCQAPNRFAWNDADDRAGAAPMVTVLMRTSEGDIWLELDRHRAPVSTENFLAHARAGHYNGTIFHRVVPEFVIQGGGWSPQLVDFAKLDAAAGKKDTPIVNEWQNGLKNDRGTIGMAREEGPDTATREWYINLRDNAKLSTAREKTGNAGYAVFGRVVDGLDVVDKIAAIPTEPRQIEGVTDGSMENVPTKVVLIDLVVRIPRAQAAEMRESTSSNPHRTPSP